MVRSILKLIIIKSFFFVFIFTFIPGFALSQYSLNLDFEHINRNNLPQKWTISNIGYIIKPDSVIKYHGRYSLSMEAKYSSGFMEALCTLTLPLQFMQSKEIILNGYIKTRDVSNGYAGLWIRIDNENKILAVDTMKNRGLSGNNNWQMVSITMNIPEGAKDIYLGALLTGKGKAWFDFFSIIIDGKKIIDEEQVDNQPSKSELDWLKKAIVPLNTVDACDYDDDLMPLKQSFMDAKITALGEVTHGSSDIFKMKHRLIKFMREKCGYSIFSIESSMPESFLLDNYVLNGEGDLKILMQGLYDFPWNTKEVLNLIEWMRNHNLKNKDKIHFTGFDMQTYGGPRKELNMVVDKFKDTMFKAKLDYLDTLFSKFYKNLADTSEFKNRDSILALVKKQTEDIKMEINKLNLKKKENDWLIQNLNIIIQTISKKHPADRDKSMAENVEWIYNQNKLEKMILWAHNGHIQKKGTNWPSMGEYLKREFNRDYLTVGFTFHKGKYSAWAKQGLGTYIAQESFPGTFEYYFKSIDIPIFALDLRKIPRDNPSAKWLLNMLLFREIGGTKMEPEFISAYLTEKFDIIIFINESHNSELLNNPNKTNSN
jgi:erythromycin esterase